MTEAEFVDLVIAEFPEIAGEVRDQDDLMYMQMGVFGRRMQPAIDRADWPALKRAVHLAQRVWQEGDADLRDALGVACVEHLAFDGPHGEHAFRMRTSDLRALWDDLERLHARLSRTPAPLKRRKR